MSIGESFCALKADGTWEDEGGEDEDVRKRVVWYMVERKRKRMKGKWREIKEHKKEMAKGNWQEIERKTKGKRRETKGESKEIQGKRKEKEGEWKEMKGKWKEHERK